MQENADKNKALRLSNEESNHITRECLKTALIYLMGEKDFEKITVTELVARSGVSRMGFYRNYKTKEDVITEIRSEISQAMRSALLSIKNPEDIKKVYIKILEAIKEQSYVFNLLVKTKMPLHYVFEEFKVLTEVFKPETTAERYIITAYNGAVSAVICKWFTEDMTEDINATASLLAELSKDVIIPMLTRQS